MYNSKMTRIANKGLYKDKSNTVYVGMTNNGVRDYHLFGELAQEESTKAIFEIGSITKVFTSVLLADLVTNHVLSLEEPVHNIFPEFKRALTNKNQVVTVKHLATHTSGLPREDKLLKRRIVNKLNPYQYYSERDLQDFFSQYTMNHIGGWNYSNLGYALLRLVIERVTSIIYGNLIKEKVTNPLELVDTTLLLDRRQQLRRVNPKTKKGVEIPPLIVDGIKGAGGLYSTMDDMLHFIELNLNSYNAAYPSLSLTHKTHTLGVKGRFNMGLGWFIEKIKGLNDEVFWTGGTTVGFHTYAGFIPSQKKGVVVLSTYHLTRFELLKVILGGGPIINNEIAKEYFMNE
ncbi:serine hydrolase domain-containing protein [Peribacillus simplex]|uniref:serine hydrolase domain-containing protein n=1 Tax=Peribacillus simplex TaxID=1478 RepID=UPI003D2DCED6